jgi:CheY-like chemotaxis protein
MSLAAPLLTGKRVLIVEDESLVAMLIEDVLEECGCSILGPCGTVDAAMESRGPKRSISPYWTSI